jgi:hypothetical protein
LRPPGEDRAAAGAEPTRSEQLRVSARGWHGVQIAVIGFIGFCGVLQQARPETPTWLQVSAGILALAALVVACVATFLVGRVAWPLYGGASRPAVSDAELTRDGRRLRTGVVLTFAALTALALGAATGWWPQEETGGSRDALVQVQASSGERWCGALGAATPGSLSIDADGSPVTVPLQEVVLVQAVADC